MLRRSFLAGVKVNHKRVYSRILAKVCAVAMPTELVKNKAQKMFLLYFEKNLPSTNSHKIPSVNTLLINARDSYFPVNRVNYMLCIIENPLCQNSVLLC